MMGVREIERSLEQWQLGIKDLQKRLMLAPTPRERERWYATLLWAQGLRAAAAAGGLRCGVCRPWGPRWPSWSVVFTDWLSMMAALGLLSRP